MAGRVVYGQPTQIPVGGSREASLGAASGELLGAYLGNRIGESRRKSREEAERERRAADIAPLAEALRGSGNPIAAALADNPDFLINNPDVAKQLIGTVAARAPEKPEAPKPFSRVVSADDPLNARFDLGIPAGQSVRAEFVRGPNGELQLAGGVASNPFSPNGEGGEDGGMFGGSLGGRSLGYITEIAPLARAGTASEEQLRLLDSAITQYTQPRVMIDPITKQEIMVRPELPEFARDLRVGGGGTPGAAPPATGPGAPKPTYNPKPLSADTESLYTTLPPELQIPPPEPGGVGGYDTFAELVMNAPVTGPIPELTRLAGRIPGLGIPAGEATSAGKLAEQFTKRASRSLRTNPRFVEGERIESVESLDLDPKVFDTPEAFFNRVVGLDDTLSLIEREMEEVTEGLAPLVTGETRGMAADTLQAVRFLRRTLLPPRVRTPQQGIEFVQSNPSGTKFLVKDDTGEWQMYEVE